MARKGSVSTAAADPSTIALQMGKVGVDYDTLLILLLLLVVIIGESVNKTFPFFGDSARLVSYG
jgi:hypothetical protein